MLAQIPQTVGNCRSNADAILKIRKEAGGVDLILFPELQLIGYPPEDLVLKPSLLAAAKEELLRLAQATADGGSALLVGTAWQDEGRIFNAVALLDQGKIAAIRYKHDLPNYGTFDEKRIFSAGPLPEPVLFKGVSLGIPICEDIWTEKLCAHLKKRGAEILLVPNGSPFESGKYAIRRDIVTKRVKETGLPCLYLNRVGGQDEIVFDGGSFVMNRDGEIAVSLPQWQSDHSVTHWHNAAGEWSCETGAQVEIPTGEDGKFSDIYQAMMMGLGDYVRQNGFSGVLLGLSGGIDSALSAAVAVDALGADKVWCVMLPSRYTSQESLDDAQACAEMLGCRLDSVPINPAVEAIDHMLAPLFAGKKPDLTEENIQSRLRGVVLMAISNKFSPMVLTTGNKSEMAVGYATLYGDMNGGYSVLKDLYKTDVFKISLWRNKHKPANALGPDGYVMPERVITKPPSAELREDQKDSDSLPPYDILDAILHGLIEEDLSCSDLVSRGYDPALVAQIENLLHRSEYKRKQSPLGVKLGSRNFGRDRRYPLSHQFRSSHS
ncbi:NAD+ synthase [Zymomonas mobilis]|uniref:Glutamine-dependent NAD(+) synthetase n=2 Tax=Zymomonas mobilis TaxID=542 RepID=A0A542W153_ZYMMB|nr:NAD+ synthase [Zymomonas mobilis]